MKTRRKNLRFATSPRRGPRARATHCPVCAGALAGSRWSCDRCHAGHHEDCARYSGGCAIFGCPDGGPPRPLDPVTRPHARRILGLYLGARRAQSLVSVLFAASAVLALLLAGSQGGLVDGASRTAAGTALATAILHGVMTALASAFMHQLRGIVGGRAGRSLTHDRARFGHSLPLARRPENPDRLESAACPVAIVGVVALFVPPMFGAGAVLVSLSVLSYGVAGQLGGRWQELRGFENRFLATFVPEKPVPAEVAEPCTKLTGSGRVVLV